MFLLLTSYNQQLELRKSRRFLAQTPTVRQNITTQMEHKTK